MIGRFIKNEESSETLSKTYRIKLETRDYNRHGHGTLRVNKTHYYSVLYWVKYPLENSDNEVGRCSGETREKYSKSIRF